MKKKLLVFGVAGLIVLLVASVCLAEIEFSVGGHFRARSYLVTNPDLVKGGPERSYIDQRLVLNPVLKLSDFIQVKARIRALDYIWGHNGVPAKTWPEMYTWDGTAASNQGELGTNNFQWDRAWVHIFFGKYGSVQIGRQQTDLFHNYAVSEEDTAPRYHYITPVFSLPNENNIMGGIFYQKITEGDPDVVTGAAGNDDMAWCPWVLFMSPKLTIGYVFFQRIWAGVGPAGESGSMIFNEAMVNANLGPVDIKSEGTLCIGKAPGSYLDWKHNFSFFVDAGVPLTTPVVNRAAVVVGLFQGLKAPTVGEAYGSFQSNEDWIDEWKIDLILWDQLYNEIQNAWIIRPKIDFVVPNSKFGGYLSACMSFADQEAQYNSAPAGITLTSGTEKTIGTEIDLGINYTLGPRQTIEAVVGLLMPGKYFAEDNRDTTLGAALKTHIRF
jgi:hypothetical protein